SPILSWNRTSSCAGSGGSLCGFRAADGARIQSTGGSKLTRAASSVKPFGAGTVPDSAIGSARTEMGGALTGPTESDATAASCSGPASPAESSVAATTRASARTRRFPTYFSQRGGEAGVISANRLGNCAALPKTHVPARADDQVIHDRYPEEPARRDGVLRGAEIVGRGLGIAGWVVVAEDDPRRVPAERLGEQLADPDRGPGDVTGVDGTDGDEPL